MSGNRLPTLTHVAVAAVLATVALRALLWPVSPNDFWWHLATGRLIVGTGSIPRVDTFSWTRAGEPFYDQPWLSQTAMYGLHGLGGVPLLIVVFTACLVLAYALLLRLLSLRTARAPLSAAVIFLSLPASASGWTFRPQVFALPLFVAFLFVLSDWRLGLTGRRPALWLLPPLALAWVNLHGSFVLGPALILVFAAGALLERRGEPGSLRRLLGWGAATLAATLINPFGPRAWTFVAGLVVDPAVRSLVAEWRPPDLATAVGALFYAYAALLVAVTVLSRRRPDATDVLTALAFLGLALTAVRHGVWFFLATIPMLAAQASSLPALARARGHGRPGRRSLRAAALALTGLAVTLALPWIKPSLPLPESARPLLAPATPVRAVGVLQRHDEAPSRLFHSEGYGSYLMWAAPERKVFIDVRVQLYPPEQIQDYRNLSAALESERLLDKYGIEGLLLEYRTQTPLARWAIDSPDWEVKWRDSDSAYLIRLPQSGAAPSQESP
jgi:hypothetical protein